VLPAGKTEHTKNKRFTGRSGQREEVPMYVSARDIASLASISLFLTTLFTWADILRIVS
jgi:hypothetical protein